MVKLLIIADDFTGALDTGVQFAKRGIETQIFTDTKLKKESISKTAQVLVVDSETRPLAPKKAYEIVKQITEEALYLGIGTIFKKTDSALRGNVGAELMAVLDASNQTKMYFIPAFPDINRITRRGVHYIDGELLENSAFGKDPFEPVKESYIPKLLKEQCQVQVKCIGTEEAFPNFNNEDKTIYLFDAENKNQMVQRVKELEKAQQLIILAGCAGLAELLPKVLHLEEGATEQIQKTDGLYIACGSLNPITREQIEYAVSKGCVRINLTPEQKLDKQYYAKKTGQNFLNMLYEMCQNMSILIVDTFDLKDKEATKEYAKKHGIGQEEIRYRIRECHGCMIRYLIDKGINHTILMTGGDTLMGFMKEIGCEKLSPICEIEKGAVLSRLSWNNQKIQVISKSGGFGDQEVLIKIAEKIIER